jgi:hypothetical protein
VVRDRIDTNPGRDRQHRGYGITSIFGIRHGGRDIGHDRIRRSVVGTPFT